MISWRSRQGSRGAEPCSGTRLPLAPNPPRAIQVRPLPNKRLLQSRQPSTSRATLAVGMLDAQQNRETLG